MKKKCLKKPWKNSIIDIMIKLGPNRKEVEKNPPTKAVGNPNKIWEGPFENWKSNRLCRF